jgi:hypothetical protein
MGPLYLVSQERRLSVLEGSRILKGKSNRKIQPERMGSFSSGESLVQLSWVILT